MNLIKDMHPLSDTPFEDSFPQIGFIFEKIQKTWSKLTAKPKKEEL